jgi:hypothetical protein
MRDDLVSLILRARNRKLYCYFFGAPGAVPAGSLGGFGG